MDRTARRVMAARKPGSPRAVRAAAGGIIKSTRVLFGISKEFTKTTANTQVYLLFNGYDAADLCYFFACDAKGAPG
jgi:hypothetical protein